MRQRPARRRGFTLIELLVVIAIIAVLIGLLVPAVQEVREAAARIKCGNNLKQMALAMHQFHDVNHAFPSAFAKPSNYGWATQILPFVEQDNLYIAINPNSTILAVNAYTSQTLPVYTCPSDIQSLTNFFNTYGKSNYAVNEQICDGGSSYRFSDITDGTSNTLLIGERDTRWQVGAIWAGRDTSTAGAGVASVIGRPNWPINTKYAGGLPCCAGDTAQGCTRFAWSSLHTANGANFAFCDGSVHFLPAAIATDPTQRTCSKPVPANVTFFNLYFKDDGNVVNGSDF